MKKAITALFLGICLLLVAAPVYSQSVGDFRSVASGLWDSTATWEVYNGTTWDPATIAPNDTTASVTVSAGDTVGYNFSSRKCYNLTVEAGALFYANTASTTNNRYIRVYGDTIKVDGTLGALVDGLGLEFRKNVLLTGSGTLYICRIRPVSGTVGAAFTFDADALITYQGSSGTGGSGVYGSNSASDSIAYIVAAGKVVTFVTYCNFTTGSSSSSAVPCNVLFQIDGTVNMEGNANFSLKTNAGYSAALVVNGTLNVGRTLYASGLTEGPNSIIVNTGGAMTVGWGIPGNCEFGNPALTVTGGGSFSILSTEKVFIGAAEGITKTAAAGPVQTATRSYSDSATYEYVGTVAQVTGDGLPSMLYGDLTINNAAGVTLSTDASVVGTLRFTAGKLLTGTKKVTAYGSVASAGAGSFVDGTLQRLVDGPGTYTWAVGQGADYLPMQVSFQTMVGGDTVGATVVDRTVTPPTASIEDTSSVLKRYYTLNNVEDITDAKLDSAKFSYAQADVEAAGLGEDTLRVFSSDGAFWMEEVILARDTAANIIVTGGIEGPKYIIIAGKAPQTMMTVKEAHDAPNGTQVTFEAMVTRAKGAFSYMQDATGGMTVRQTSGAWFDSVASGSISSGTMVRVTGVTSEFNSLKQINTVDLKGWQILSGGNPLPAPAKLTLAQLKANGEDYEGMLVRVINISVNAAGDTAYRAARTYSITDPSDSTNAVALRTPNASDGDIDGTKIFPIVTFEGVVGQFSSSDPAAGYQLMAIQLGDVTDNALAVEELPNGMPQTYVLQNNYPNPFNPTTAIVYGLPSQSRVTVKVYSLLGQEMKTLVDELQGASFYRVTWDGRDNYNRSVSSGVYFVRLVAEEIGGNGQIFVDTKKMVMMK